MHHHLDQLKEVHAAFIAALDGGDVEQVSALADRRADLIDALRRDFETATEDARSAIQPELAALLPLDRDLQTRAGSLRDHLGGELDQRRESGSRPAPSPTITGIIDRQA